jgi:hypothetical protein
MIRCSCWSGSRARGGAGRPGTPGRGIHPQMLGQQPRRPVRHAEPGRRRCQRGGQDLGPVHCPRPARASLILQPRSPERAYRSHQPITVGRDTPTRSAISVSDTPSAATHCQTSFRCAALGLVERWGAPGDVGSSCVPRQDRDVPPRREIDDGLYARQLIANGPSPPRHPVLAG